MDAKEMQATSLSCLNKHHDRCKGWHGPWDSEANHEKTRCVCPCHDTDREAFHKAAIEQAGRHAQAHPEMVDDYSDADPGL